MTWRRFLLFVLLCVSQACANTKGPTLWNVPVSFVPFWGRKSETLELEEKIQKGPVVVTGPSGMGKSRFVFTYAKKHAHKYRVVWVFDASQGMDRQMIDFANKLYAVAHKGTEGAFVKKEEASHYVKTLLRTCAFSWLLIFDGVASAQSVKDALPETFGAKDKHVVMTSLSSRETSGVLKLQALTDAEAKTFLKHYLPQESDEALGTLARLLENHPLAMLQAATYIKATPGMDIKGYITFFTQNKKAYWDSEAKALQGQVLLSTAIKMSIDKLKAASQNDYTVLVALAMLNTTKIEDSLIEKAYANLDGADMGGFGKIQDVALVTSEGSKAYRIHDYVRDVVLATADKETLQKAADLNAKVFLSLFPKKIEDCVGVFEKNPALVDHMKLLSAHIDEMEPENAAKIGIRILYFAEVVTRDYLFAIELCKKFKTLLDSGAVSDPFVIGAFYNWYGDTVLINGSVDKSIDAFKRAYEALKRADPEEARHELILLLSDHLGFFHHWKGDLTAVEGYLNEAKALYAGQDNLLLAAALEELDVVLKQDKGQFEETLPILDNLSAALEKDPAVNKVGGHFVKSLKACSLLKLAQLKSINGQKDEAKALREQAYAVAQDAYQHARASADGHENHEIVGRVLVYLSQAQSALGMYKEAEKSALQAIKNLDDDLVKTHVIRRQGVAHMALGDAYMGQKKYDAAFKEYKEAEDIFTEISSHLAFDDMSEVWARLVDNAIVRGDANTARRCLAAHKETFDGLHPRYIVMAAKVASV